MLGQRGPPMLSDAKGRYLWTDDDTNIFYKLTSIPLDKLSTEHFSMPPVHERLSSNDTLDMTTSTMEREWRARYRSSTVHALRDMAWTYNWSDFLMMWTAYSAAKRPRPYSFRLFIIDALGQHHQFKFPRHEQLRLAHLYSETCWRERWQLDWWNFQQVEYMIHVLLFTFPHDLSFRRYCQTTVTRHAASGLRLHATKIVQMLIDKTRPDILYWFMTLTDTTSNLVYPVSMRHTTFWCFYEPNHVFCTWYQLRMTVLLGAFQPRVGSDSTLHRHFGKGWFGEHEILRHVLQMVGIN